jgi:hypothetical protein
MTPGVRGVGTCLIIILCLVAGSGSVPLGAKLASEGAPAAAGGDQDSFFEEFSADYSLHDDALDGSDQDKNSGGLGEDWGGKLFNEHDQLNDPEAGLAEEWDNFMRFDRNDDAEVDLSEWLAMLAPGASHADGSQAERWKKEFDEADLGKDGTLNWNEWQVMLFHEQVRRCSASRTTTFLTCCT